LDRKKICFLDRLFVLERTKQEKYSHRNYLIDFMFNFSHFHGYFDLLFAALSGYSVVFISVERWFSVWKPFEKAKYVTFKTTIITVVSYISISIIAFSWFPLILNYNPKSGERCQLQRPTVYKILGTISVIFTYIGKRNDFTDFVCLNFIF
jgi:hypothetical protein